MKTIPILFLTFLSYSGFAQTLPFPSKIIGPNNFVQVNADGSNIALPLRPVIDAVGLLEMPIPNSDDVSECTVTHLGNGYALTAGHCFLEAQVVDTLTNESCEGMTVLWGYRSNDAQGHPSPTLKGDCEKIIYAEKGTFCDFALIKVAQYPKAAIPPSFRTERVPEGTKITILGHPMRRPLEWSQYCTVKKSEDRFHKGPNFFFHECDTEPASSGSAVLEITSAGTPEIVGVHDAASPDQEYNSATSIYDVERVLTSQGIDLEKRVNSR